MLPATNQINIGDSPPGPAAMVGSAPAASMDAVTSDMLLRAAQQQRRLASLLPDEAAQADVLALASQQEAQAAAILGGADATTPAHPWQQQKQLETSTSHHACAANAATAASAASANATSADPGLPSAMGISAASAYAANASAPLSSCGASATHAPINYVRAVLRRDSNDLFKLVLREKRTESFAGVVIAQLLESDSGDERAKLHEGDTLRTVNGLNPSAMRFDDLRAYVRDCPGALHIEVDRVLAWPPPLDAAASQWQDGASAATGRAAFVAPPGMDPTVGLRGSSGPGGDSVSGGTGSGAARLPPSLAPPRRFEPSEPPGDNLLGELGHRLGDKVKEVLEKPEVRELRGKAEETGREWLHGFRSLIDAGRETLEESGHSLRVIGDDLKSHAERMKESLSARGGGAEGAQAEGAQAEEAQAEGEASSATFSSRTEQASASMRGEARWVTCAARHPRVVHQHSHVPLCYTTRLEPTASGRTRLLLSCLTRCRTLWSRQARLRPLCLAMQRWTRRRSLPSHSHSPNRASRRPCPPSLPQPRHLNTPWAPRVAWRLSTFGAARWDLPVHRRWGPTRFLRHATTAEVLLQQSLRWR